MTKNDETKTITLNTICTDKPGYRLQRFNISDTQEKHVQFTVGF